MTTATFDKAKKGQIFYRYFPGGRYIVYEKTGKNTARLIGLDYPTPATRNAIGNTEIFDAKTTIHI